MSDAIAEAAAVNRRMGNDEDFGRTLAAGNSRLNSATAAFRSAIPYDDLQKDAADNPELYSSALTKVLGSEGAMGSAGPESAPAVVLPNAASSDPERAPREPVSVKVLRSTTATYSISFGRLESAAQNAAGSPTSVPRSADVDPNEYWRGLGTETRVGMFTLNGGLLYVGRGLSAVARGMLEPALIDPTLPIQPDAADCRTRMLGYWSSYSYATPAARASYLQWLGSGRSDPHADVGYVFLYFYGLERRALFDAEKYESARLEIPGIVHEVQRLREIYASNNSFDRYSSEFLEYIEGLGNVGSGDDIEAEPRLEKFRVSFALKRKLASFAVSRTPLPANWAYAWYHNDPRARLPMVAQRCPNEVRKLFAYEYGLAAGEGLILPVNKTVLKLSYRPASASFGGAIGVATALPDVSVLTGPYEKLAKIATSCFEKLGAYSRYIGRTGVDNSSLDALLLLPAQVWPKQSVDQLAELKQLTQKTNKPFVLSVRDLLKQFGSDEPPSKARFLGLAGALEQSGVAIEPDLRFGGTAPALDDPIALFTLTDKSELTPTFGAAALLLEVGAAIASADGDFSEPEAEFLRRKFAADPRLSDSDRARLSARIEVYRKKPRPLSTLKRTIEHVGIEMRDAILTFLLEMVHADGVIAPQEIAVMERIYTMFGLDAATLYTRLHTVAAGSQDASSKVIKPGEAIQIDKVKVQKLIADSAAITAKLTVIFDKTEEVEAEEQLRAEKAPSADGELAPTLLGLDKDHGELLATILERAQWTRAEFDDLCADRQLMPDGAIERINEAAYDKFDAPIIEGDDPLEINTQLLQQLAA
jgi:uncharacterized tellurite resistance protein B-like protein